MGKDLALGSVNRATKNKKERKLVVPFLARAGISFSPRNGVRTLRRAPNSSRGLWLKRAWDLKRVDVKSQTEEIEGESWVIARSATVTISSCVKNRELTGVRRCPARWITSKVARWNNRRVCLYSFDLVRLSRFVVAALGEQRSKHSASSFVSWISKGVCRIDVLDGGSKFPRFQPPCLWFADHNEWPNTVHRW